MTRRLVFFATVLLLLSGCANTITERISLAETCQRTLDTAAQAPTWEATRTILKARLGKVATCPDAPDKLIMQCVYDDMSRRLAIADRHSVVHERYEKLKNAVDRLDNKLEAELVKSDARAKTISQTCSDPTTRQQCIHVAAAQATQTLRSGVIDDLAAVYKALAALRAQMEHEAAVLPSEVARELIIWEKNVKAQLAGFERALGGDARALILDAGRNEVLRYAARRSLDMLHRSLRPADAALTKADEKAYGAISFGYVGFGGNLQRAVNEGYDSAVNKFRERLTKSNPKAEDLTQRFQFALQRAACENVSGGTDYTILTELVDTMFIMKAGKELPKEATKAPEIVDVALAQSPLNAYVVHEWAAREMVLTRQLVTAPHPVDKGGKHMLPEAGPVDERLVANLAESAAAVSIDDQLRADPNLLSGGSASGAVRVSLAGAVQSVNQITAILSNSVNVSNVNTFAPNNNVAPVVNVYPREHKPAPSLCTDGGLRPGIADCMIDGAGYVLRLKSFHDSGTCNSTAVENSMAELGAAIHRFAVTTGQTFHGQVNGYASQRRGEGMICEIAQGLDKQCVYWNAARERIKIGSCLPAGRGGDVNTILSAGRASHAARALEAAAESSVLVRSLAARGTQGARVLSGNDDVDADRSVVIRLWPASTR